MHPARTQTTCFQGLHRQIKALTLDVVGWVFVFSAHQVAVQPIDLDSTRPLCLSREGEDFLGKNTQASHACVHFQVNADMLTSCASACRKHLTHL
jgi:hypothetical protein